MDFFFSFVTCEVKRCVFFHLVDSSSSSSSSPLTGNFISVDAQWARTVPASGYEQL